MADGRPSRLLVALLVCDAFAVALDLVFWVRFLKLMRGFEWFVSQVLYPASVALALWPCIWGLHFTGRLPSQNGIFPKRYFVMLGFMGTVMNYTEAIGGAILPGVTQTIFFKAQIVTTMGLSYAILGTRFKANHAVGAATVLAATVVDVYPQLTAASNISAGGNASGVNGTGGYAATTDNVFLALVMLTICITVPKSVYQEKYTKASDLSPVYFRGWEALLQCGIGACLIPLAFVQFVPTQPALDPECFPNYVSSALSCFMGSKPTDGSYPDAVCEDAWLVWCAFAVCNVTHDVLTIAIAKFASAATGTVWGSASLIVTVALMQVPALTGQPVTTLSPYTALSCAMIVTGLFIYGQKSEISSQLVYKLEAPSATRTVVETEKLTIIDAQEEQDIGENNDGEALLQASDVDVAGSAACMPNDSSSAEPYYSLPSEPQLS